CWWRQHRSRRDRNLHRRLVRNVAIAKHDIVRIDEAGDHEEGPGILAIPTCFTRGFAQPAHRLACDEGIVDKAAPRSATDIPTRAEYVKAVGLESGAVVDRRLGIENFFVHFKLAEVRGLVAKSFQYRSPIRQVRAQARHEVVLHLIKDTIDLRRLPAEERRTGRRAHGGCDVMVAERDAVTGNRIDAWQRIIIPGKQPVCPLVANHEDDVVWRLAGFGPNRLTLLSLREGIPKDRHQVHDCQQSQAAVEEFLFHVAYSLPIPDSCAATKNSIQYVVGERRPMAAWPARSAARALASPCRRRPSLPDRRSASTAPPLRWESSCR